MIDPLLRGVFSTKNPYFQTILYMRQFEEMLKIAFQRPIMSVPKRGFGGSWVLPIEAAPREWFQVCQ